MQKLKTRTSKRGALPADHPLKHPRYDTAMTLQAMSDDEDKVQNGERVQNVFVSRAPTYRSAEVSAVLREVALNGTALTDDY